MDSPEIDLVTRKDRILLRVRVQPRASRTELAGVREGQLRIRLKAPPVDGAANAELLRFLGRKVLGVPPSSLEIVRGAGSRDKTVAISGLSTDQVRDLLPG